MRPLQDYLNEAYKHSTSSPSGFTPSPYHKSITTNPPSQNPYMDLLDKEPTSQTILMENFNELGSTSQFLKRNQVVIQANVEAMEDKVGERVLHGLGWRIGFGVAGTKSGFAAGLSTGLKERVGRGFTREYAKPDNGFVSAVRGVQRVQVERTVPYPPKGYKSQPNLPHGGRIAPQTAFESIPSEAPKEVKVAPKALYSVSKSTAESALMGFKPFGDDLDKQERYVRFLDGIVALEVMDWLDADESREFSKSALLFRPLNAAISNRFSSQVSTEIAIKLEREVVLVRTSTSFKPSKLLCQRTGCLYREVERDTKLNEMNQVLNVETMRELKDLSYTKNEIEVLEEFNGDSTDKPKDRLLELDLFDSKGAPDVFDAKMPDLMLFKSIFEDEEPSVISPTIPSPVLTHSVPARSTSKDANQEDASGDIYFSSRNTKAISSHPVKAKADTKAQFGGRKKKHKIVIYDDLDVDKA